MIESLLASAAGAGGLLQPVLDWFRLDDPWARWLAVFGVLGQAIFFGRWIIQWISSERRRESHVPEMFWWFSLTGAAMLFTYFVLRHDIVGMLGQGVGWTVYCRNLYLIRAAKHRSAADEPVPAAGHEPAT